MTFKHCTVAQVCNYEERYYDWSAPRDNRGMIQSKMRMVNNRDTFQRDASVNDTYLIIVSPSCKQRWDANKDAFKGWIKYESPKFHNLSHTERTKPSLQLFVLEKPKRWKPKS